MPKVSAYKSLGRKLGGYKAKEYKAVGLEYAKEHVSWEQERREKGIQGVLASVGEISRIYEAKKEMNLYEKRQQDIQQRRDTLTAKQEGYLSVEDWEKSTTGYYKKQTEENVFTEIDPKELPQITPEATFDIDQETFGLDVDEGYGGSGSPSLRQESAAMNLLQRQEEGKALYEPTSPTSVMHGGTSQGPAPAPLVSEGGYRQEQTDPGGAERRFEEEQKRLEELRLGRQQEPGYFMGEGATKEETLTGLSSQGGVIAEQLSNERGEFLYAGLPGGEGDSRPRTATGELLSPLEQSQRVISGEYQGDTGSVKFMPPGGHPGGKKYVGVEPQLTEEEKNKRKRSDMLFGAKVGGFGSGW